MGLSAVVGGCSEASVVSEAVELSDLKGLLVFEERGLLVMPPEWGDGRADLPFCSRSGSRLFLHLNETRGADLDLRFAGKPGSTVPEELTWDNTESLTSRTGEGGLFRIPRALLEPGRHSIAVLRNRDEDRVCLSGLTGGTNGIALERRQWVHDFSRFGLVGERARRVGGCLFRGPNRLSRRLASPAEGTISFLLVNNSRSEARFSVGIGGETSSFLVPANGERRARVRSRAGADELLLTVEGDPEGLFLWGEPSHRLDRADERPPVVLITLDTTRRDALSPYGAAPRVTPAIARFAARGGTYTSAFSTSPWTLPSHASIFTGLYPWSHEAGVTRPDLSPELVTLPQRLGRDGYRTGAFVGGVYPTPESGMGRGFDRFVAPPEFEIRARPLTDEAIQWLTEGEMEGPFFLFVNYFDPHGTYSAPPAWNRRFITDGGTQELDEHPVWKEWAANGSREAWRQLRHGRAGFPRAGLKIMRKRYLAEVAYMDHQLGRLLGELDGRGLLEPALVVLVADHGELLGERRRFGHSNSLDPELTHVPLLVKWPGQRDPFVESTVVSQVDLHSTILEAAGIELPADEGRPLPRPNWADGDRAPAAQRREVYAEEHDTLAGFHFLTRPIAQHLYSKWRGDLGLVVWRDGRECYRLADGVRWRRSRCAREPWAAPDQELATLPAAAAGAEAAGEEKPAPVDEEELERLRALGYIN